jgi:Zn-dependent peptidase ImmA (M78 family)/DNA-binding XRE family transcriptional regulator
MSVHAHVGDGASGAKAARLRAAREARGLTQAEAAAALGVSRPLLVAIEQGSREVQPAELVKLAGIYATPVSELLRTTQPPTAVGARIRAVFPAAVRDSNLTESITRLEQQIDAYLDLLSRSGARPPGREAPVRSMEHLDAERAGEDAAIDERNRLGAGDGPTHDLRELLEFDVGLPTFMLPMPARVAGLFVHVDTLGGYVAVNERHPVERRRWTMAHEYAHYLASRHRAEVTTLAPQRRRDALERFAEAFAANFLMPRNGLVRRFHELKRGRDGRVTPAMLVQLAHSYQVSVQALVLRLESLGLLRSGTWDKLRDTEFQSRVAVRRIGPEPGGNPADTLPLNYRLLAAQLYADAEITESQFARYLGTDIVGARREYERLTATHDVADDGSARVVNIAETAE